jgi:hypothetical protein
LCIQAAVAIGPAVILIHIVFGGLYVNVRPGQRLGQGKGKEFFAFGGFEQPAAACLHPCFQCAMVVSAAPSRRAPST